VAPVLGYGYREWLDDRVHLNKVKSAFVWDVTLAGAEIQEIQRKRAEWVHGPEMGTVLIHNEGEKWNAAQPRIEAGIRRRTVGRSGCPEAPPPNALRSRCAGARLLVATGALLPEHYLSEGGPE
jgi:hypothetical protein